ncbi:glycosyltransferase family 2 protein [Flavobacterium sp.]|uniref:glycosyltransferase family 2 protein n=1 Tax=Flavobacterium sp. TaxID=239 RepID=UPI002FDD5B22
MPFFSVIIALYNKEKFVENTIKSVLAQHFSDFELLIVNDGSTDNSETKVLSFTDPRIRYFSKPNEGVAATRNFGIDKATAEFICFLDADDYWYPEFLEVMHYYIGKLPDQKVFACGVQIETEKSSFPAQYSVTKTGDYEIVNYFEASAKKSIIWTSGVALHRRVLEAVGVFDEQIKKGEDTELWMRIGLQFPVVFIWQILARYVYDHQSISRGYHYFFEDYTFSKYAALEQENPLLKKFMDLNRFSACIKCKIIGNPTKAKALFGDIDSKNLNWKKRILVRLPAGILKLLIRLKTILADCGLGKSVFR